MSTITKPDMGGIPDPNPVGDLQATKPATALLLRNHLTMQVGFNQVTHKLDWTMFEGQTDERFKFIRVFTLDWVNEECCANQNFKLHPCDIPSSEWCRHIGCTVISGIKDTSGES